MSGTGGQNSADPLEEARDSVAAMICTTDAPPRTFVSPQFKKVVKLMNPSADNGVGDFNSIKAACLKFYERDAIRIKHALANVDAKMNLSVETYRTQTFESFMCLTAHFIDESWKLRKWVLMFKTLYCDTMAEDIWKCLEQWGISDKIASLALRGFDFDGSTRKQVKDYIQERSQVLVDGKLFHVCCSSELLASMAQGALDEIPSDIMDNLRMLYSWGRSEPMWHITNSHLQEGLQLLAMGEFASDPCYQEYLPSPNEWEIVNGVSKLVDKVEAAAEALFHAKHPYASSYLANLQVLHASLVEQECCSFVSPIREKMLNHLKKYWEDMLPLLAVAAVMDPRCKMAFVEYASSKVPCSNGDSSTQSSSVLEIVRSVYDSYLTTTPQPQLESSDSGSNPSDEELEEEVPGSAKKRKIETAESVPEEESSSDGVNVGLTSYLQGYQQHVEASKQPVQTELDMYLEEPVVAWDQDFKLLKWWKRQTPKYPVLSRMARDLLAIPLTVSSSYDGYYTEDRYVDLRLLSTKRDLINALSCTRSWNPNP